VSLSYESDEMQEKFFICMKKSENGSLMKEGRRLDENDESRSRELDQNEVCAFFSFDKSFSYDHR
jgi:hypothetical protein